MTGEPTHTASKERMVPELMFSSERVPQLSQTASKMQWPLCFAFSYVQPVTQCYRRKMVKEMPLQQSSHHKNTTIRAPPTINYCPVSAAAITLHFQLCSARYTALQQRTELESSLQSVQSPRKIQTIPVYKRTVGKPWIALPRINTLAVSKKKWDTKEDKGKSMMHALYVLRYAKRHVSG